MADLVVGKRYPASECFTEEEMELLGLGPNDFATPVAVSYAPPRTLLGLAAVAYVVLAEQAETVELADSLCECAADVLLATFEDSDESPFLNVLRKHYS